MFEELTRYFEANREGILELAFRLIREKTENPPGNEYLAAAPVEAFLRDAGIPFTTHAKEEGRTNLVVRLGAGSPKLFIGCHLDVVPAGSGWDTDPYEPVIKEGRLYGRGAVDNKGPLAATLYAARFLVEKGIDLKGELQLVALADEEAGSTLGVEYLLQEEIIKPDLAIIPDITGNLRDVSISEKGLLHLKLISKGIAAHGSRPADGVNAIWNMVDLLAGLKRLALPGDRDEIFTPPGLTLNLGKIQGGTATNVVPNLCEVDLDIRYLPEQSAEDIVGQLRRLMEEESEKIEEATFELTKRVHLPPYRIEEDHELVNLIRESAERVVGVVPRIIGLSGTTVAKQFIERNIPAVGFAPGDHEAPHTANESIDVEELIQFGVLTGLICLHLLTGEQG
jgi:acetylornithine deacetylase/succinyl-diaminopimelate desuccinylase family protein